MGLGKKIITGFHNKVVMTLNDPILFTSMRTRALVNDAMFCEEMSERAKLSSPIDLYIFQFGVQLTFNHGSRICKYGINIKLMRKRVKLHVKRVMINP